MIDTTCNNGRMKMTTTRTMSLALAGVLPLMVVACSAADGGEAVAGQVAEAAAETVVEALPLRRGYYVRTDDECGTASRATLALVRRDGISGCSFEHIEQVGGSRYRIRESCTEHQAPAPSTYEVVQEYEVLAEERYRVTFEYGESAEFRHCPQHSLPDPWRDNDISDVLD
jgi:hypothetical protein